MSLNNKHCLLFLVIFAILLFGVTMASATEVKDVNNMQEIMDDIKLSTPDNHDVDKVVQSSTSQSSTDAEVKNYNTSDKTNYSEISEITNRQTENAIKTNEFNITSKNTNLNKNIQQKVKSEGEGSFTELQRLINENSVIDLGQNYQFISGTDDDELVDGIVINKDLTIYGNGFTIDAKNSARIFKISGTDINVELINIKLINANSTLRDNDGNGGAIYTDSHLTIQDCTFTNNGANNGGAVFATKQSDAEYVDSLTIDNCNFTENIALVNGGAINIFEESDNVKMLNSNFTNNRVIGYNNSDNSRWYGDGGAICFNKTSTNALIDNSIFINNTVNANGGAIMWKGEYGNITNSKFYNNSAPYAAGALRLDGSHVVVNNTLFDGNYDSKGNYSWGSAIYLTGNYTNITYSNFTNNYNSNNGTIAISGSNEMLENNIFINNSAYNGGAVYIRKNENVTFDYNTFTKNNAGNNGGAVFISDHANNTKILNSIFTDNKAIGYNISATNWIGNGGAVFFDTGCHEGLIDNSTFTNNSANANGGAVVWNGNDGNITSSKFYNNSAPYAGGALRLSGNRLLVNDSVFEGNYDPVGSNSWGLAVYISGNNCNITYSNFTNNYGGETAGAIYVAGTNATVKYSLFENNSANDKGGAINIRGNNAILFNNNITANKVTAGDGGAVYIQGANTTIEYCNIANNNATVHGGAVYSNGNNLTMDYCNLTFNSVCNVTLNTLSQGGAMYLASSHNARVNYCNFTSNYASNAGGAMFWVSSNNIIMNNSYFFNCSCGITNGSKATSPADHGGAINFNSNKNNTVNNCTFDSCFSEKDGGAIFYAASDSSGSVISNSTFINCYSVFRSAGAVAWKEKNGQILDTKFINCYSLSGDSPTFSGKGGAMYFEKAKNNILLNVSFINCSALYEGAAIYYRNTDNDPSSNNTHINCTFINNNVTRNGGALAFASANETYDGCIFVNNSASNGGSICYSVNGGIIIRNSIFVNNTNITNGGFIYINGSKVEITNNTFNNGSAENGGAIYVNTAVTINDSSFTNNTAENGGALYITKDTTLNNCNVTNNNATKGSGIYVNSGKLTLKTVKLIENQAHSKEFDDISDNVIGDKRSISGVFTGWDNYLNGIYVVTDNVVFEDVLYLGIDNLGTVAIVNTDETSATIHNLLNESAQLIYLDIYGRDGSVQTLQNFTDEYGNFKFEFDNNADDSYKIYHLEDNYYTELVYTFNKNLVNITLNVTNITYGNSESIKINVTGNASDIPTGTVLVYLNSTLDGFTNRTYEATLEDGFVSIDDAPLDLLNVSTYDVYVRYIGDEHYLSGNATATFVVSNAKPSLNIGISDYTYNETKTIIFDLIGINDEPITGKVIFNITGTESDGTPYSLTDIEINITRDEHGVIVNNTYELPVLNATGVDNNYEIVAFSPESTNYNSTNNSTTFKVFKAQPVINVTAYNITTDGMFAVDVHVEPEIANGTVNLFINTTEGKEYVLTLDDSRASIDLDKLPRGNYTATATYNGDKNHNYPVSNSTKFEVLYDDFPIDIQLRNMTYGETQIISISVPKDYEGTLKIKFNGTELTEEYYTIEDGVIYIDTGDLTNVVEDGILIVGEYNLSVNYTPAENDYYRANCTDKLFNVTRADPNIIISTEEIGYLSNETITINLTSYNATGKINITVVNITEEGSTYTNYSVDIKNDTVVTVTIPDLEIGTYNVIVEYCNDTNYNNKRFTETFKVLPLVISITLNRPEIYVDEFETIFGSVTDISGRKVTTGKVNVTISNESGYITSYLVDVDSESGLYFTTNRYNIEGTLYANATYILGDKIIANSTTKSFVVSKIPTITNVTVVNSTVGKVTIDVSVRENATPTATSSGYTNPITEGKLNVTVNGESKLFDITGSTTPIVLDVDPVNINTTETVDFTVEYIGDYKHNSSFGVNNTTCEKITEFTASPIGSNLTINVVPNPVQTGENVTISGQVFDDLGNLIKSGKVNVSIDGVFQGEYDINETTGYYTLNYTTSTVKDVNVEVNFTGIKTEDDSRYIVSTSSNVTTFTVEKIPTITNVTVTNHTVGNVTLKITVEDENGNIIKDGKVHITIAGNDPIEVELSGEDYTVVYLLDNMTSVGNISVTVEYTGNDTYLPSVANNTDDNKVLKNITVTPHNSSITVDVIPKNTTIGENVTISGQLVDEMSNNISNADLVIYVDGVGFAAKTNATGGYSFNYTTTRIADDIVVNATFDGGDNYNSTSANTTFNVTKIATKTNVTIVNTTIGNVVIHVKVTDLSDYPVERGHVVVCNQTGQIVGEGELVNGGVDITLNVTTVGNIKVNVTYQENDVYYGSNATNSSLSDDHPEINITNIDVVKQEASISIGLNPEVLIVGENVYIRGTVSVGDKFITSGQVNVTINGTNTTVNINSDGSYNLTYTAGVAGEYTVNATYLGNDSIDPVTSSNAIFTVNKIPTNTTITVINNTAGNVTIEVTVTNSTGAPVSMGDIKVEFEDGTTIETVTLINGKANVTIPSANTDTLDVNVTYIENAQYMESKKSTAIDVLKQNATITIEIINDNVTVGDVVTITGQVIDGMGNIINSGDVDVVVDGLVIPTTISDGKYTINNVTYTAGVYKVNATYKGNATVNEVTSETLEFTVNKIPTIVTISPISDVEVNKPLTIEVTLTDKTGEAIIGKNIIITVNDVALAGIPVTDANGKTSIKYTPRDNTDLVIKAIYLPTPDEVYLGNESETTVKVAMSQSTITVKVNDSDVYVGESVNISGTLKDGQGNNISSAQVTIYINGNPIPVSTDAYGNYSYIYSNSKADEYNVLAVYDGEPNAIIGDSDTTSYNVQKMHTNVTITLPDEVEVFVPFDIEVTLTNNTDNHNPVSGKSIIIRVNGDVISNVPLTDNTGKTVVSYTPQNNDTIVVEAVFSEDNYYLGDNDQKTIAGENIHISNSTITVGVNESQLYVDESVKITGKLTDKQGNAIPLANVKIYINYNPVGTVETNSTGEYSYVVRNLNKGNYEVLVVYDGVEDIRSHCNNTTSYVVSLIPTITEVTVLNSTVGNVTIDVVVKENVPGRHTEIVSAGAFEVTVNDTTVQYPIRDRNTTITLDGDISINTTDELPFNVKHLENMKYQSSNGVNSSTGEEITKFKADSQQSTITVNVTPENQSYGAEVIISGHVYDGMGNEITSGNVYITVNDGTPIEVPLNENGYSKEYVSDIVGLNNVKVEFKDVLTEESNVLIKGSNNKTTFNVDKKPTNTVVEILNNTAGNVTLNISVTGIDGNKSMTGKVNITIDGKTLQVDLDGSESIVVALKDNITRSGNINVTAVFDGNDLYLPSVATIGEDVLENITVANVTALLTVEVNKPVTGLGSIETIYGNLTDDMGNNITDAYVTVYVNGEKVDTVKTNSTGGYNVTYLVTEGGVNDVVVTYDGDYIKYSNATASTSFNVIKLNSTVNVDVADIIYGDVESINISINESDAAGNVTVYVNSTVEGFENITKELRLVDAKTQLNLSDLNAGTYNVTVVYPGDSKYEGNTTIVEFTVDKLADYDVNITAMNITYGDDETITVKLPEDATGLVTISIDGITISEDTKELSGGVAEFTIPKYTGLAAGDYTVKVTYSGDRNYVGKQELTTQFNVAKAESHINVTVDNTRSDKDANVVLNISDFNATGKANVTLYNSDNVIISNIVVDPMTSEELSVVLFEKLLPGEYTVNVTYYDDKNYNNSKSSTTFTVGKIPTITEVTILNNTAGNVTIDIRVTGEDGNDTMTGTVNITVNGHTIPVELTGTVNKTVKLDIQDSGINYVKVEFTSNDNYLPSIGNNTETGKELTNITVSKQIATLTVNATPNNVTIGQTVTITGKLTDGMNNTIPDAYIEITLNGDRYITTTDSNGEYSLTNVTVQKEVVDVVAIYKGNNTVNATSAITNFTVDKIPTITLVSVANNTANNVSIDVIVIDNNGNFVTTGRLTVTYEGATTSVPITNQKTNIPLHLYTNGTFIAKVEYAENDVYMNSTGLDKVSYDIDPENAKIFKNITVIKQNTTITVTTITPVKVGNSTIISGKLVDEQSRPIPDVTIVVIIDGKEVGSTFTGSDGTFTFEPDDTIVGTHNVTCRYDGNGTFNASEGTSNFVVEKRDAKISIEKLEDIPVGNDLNIIGKLEDEFGIPIKDTEINVTFDGNTQTVKTDNEGNFNARFPTNNVGTKDVSINFYENENYTETSLEDTVKIIPISNVKINIDTPVDVEAGEPINITGNVTDGDGNLLAGVPLNVTLNNETYNVTTDENGRFSVPFDNVVTGQNNITVSSKDEKYDTEAKDKFFVPVLDTNITIDPIDDTLVGDDVVVSGRLLDENGKAVSGADVTVSVDGVNQTVVTDKDGRFNATFPTSSVGTKLVTVEYSGNDKYDGAKESAVFDVYKDTAVISLDEPVDVEAGEPVNITGTVVDESGNPVSGLPVNVTVNGETREVTTDENGQFNVPFDNVVPGQNNVTVSAGNDTVDVDTVEKEFFVPVLDTNITIDPIDDTLVGGDVVVSGRLLDENGKAVSGADVTVSVDGVNQTVVTDKDGRFNATFPTSSVGTKLVTVEYSGNDKYDGAKESAVFDVYKDTAVISLDEPVDVEAGEPVNITGTVVDENGDPVSGLPVNVTVNGETREVTTDKDGKFTVPFDNVVPGQNNITVSAGNDTVDVDTVEKEFFVPVLDTNITIDPIDDTLVGGDVVVSGRLLDENGKAVSGADVTVSVDGVNQTVQTDENGKYTATFPTDSVGTKDVKVEYAGNEKYDSAKEDAKANVLPNNGTLSLELPTDAVVGEPTSINGTLTNQDGKAVPNTPVNVTVNGKVYSTTTDENGKFTVPIDNVVAGTNNIKVSAGNENITVKDVEDTFNADKQNSILTIDPISDAKMGDNVTITGKLTDERGNPISDSVVTITVNGEEFNVTTDSEGKYELPLTNAKNGLNNVSVTFESDIYKSATNSTNFTLTKIKTIVTVDSIVGTVGEKITLVAHVTDENGNKVSGGNLVFKINGKTLRMDGRFDTNDTDPMKFKVVDGIVTYTMNVELYLRAGKNITASYSGSYRYEEAKGNVASVGIRKRNAELTVEVVPNPAKQNSDTVFIVKLRDVTPNGTNKTCITTDAGLILKVNGITLKDEDGKKVYVKADSTTVTYTYHVPTGMAGVDNNGNIRNYTVEAVYNNSMFYPDTRNTSVFNVQRSIVNINFEDVTVKNNMLSVKGTFTDYENDLLVGNNKICVKINGITYKENNETKYFTVRNGIVDLSGIKIDSGTKVKSVTLVTGDTSAYLSARETTKDISTS